MASEVLGTETKPVLSKYDLADESLQKCYNQCPGKTNHIFTGKGWVCTECGDPNFIAQIRSNKNDHNSPFFDTML